MGRRLKKGTGIGIIAFVVLNICGIVAYRKIGLEDKLTELSDRKNELVSELQEEEERKIDIKNLEAYVQTKKYIEEIAREKLGLVYEYEIIFKEEE